MWLMYYTLKISIEIINGNTQVNTISSLEISNPEMIAQARVETEMALSVAA